MEFTKDASKMGGTCTTSVRNKFLNGEFQLVYELVNKVILLRLEKRTIALGVDLFVMECLSKFELVSLPALIIEHTYKFVHVN